MKYEDRRERLEELRVINRRKILTKKIESKTSEIDIKGFLTIEDTLEVYDEVYEKIDSIGSKVTIKNGVEYIKEFFLSVKNDIKKMDNITMILLHSYDLDTGALKIPLYDFFINIDVFLDEKTVIGRFRDILLVGEHLSLGICVRKGDDKSEVILWGI